MDSVTYRAAAAPVRVDLALDSGPDGDVLNGIDNVDGTDGDDVLIGDSGWNQLRGLGGDDQLDGREATDRLEGGDGFDVLEGGAGDDDLRDGASGDRLSGGDGDDRFQLPQHSDADVRCGAGRDHLVARLTPRVHPRLRADLRRGPGRRAQARPADVLPPAEPVLAVLPGDLPAAGDHRRPLA